MCCELGGFCITTCFPQPFWIVNQSWKSGTYISHVLVQIISNGVQLCVDAWNFVYMSFFVNFLWFKWTVLHLFSLGLGCDRCDQVMVKWQVTSTKATGFTLAVAVTQLLIYNGLGGTHGGPGEQIAHYFEFVFDTWLQDFFAMHFECQVSLPVFWEQFDDKTAWQMPGLKRRQCFISFWCQQCK